MLAWKQLRKAWENLTLRILAEPAPAGAGSTPHRMAVLLVARDYSLRESLGVMGAVNRWDVHWARSRDEALGILGLQPIPLVICDEEAPDGWRTIVERIGALPGSTCVLLASRFCDEALGREARRCHAYDVIAKPFNWEQVTNRVLFAWAWYTSGCACWWGPSADRPNAGDAVLHQREQHYVK